MALRDTLVWIDLEMTGLDPDRDRILEIATIVTDSALNVLPLASSATGPPALTASTCVPVKSNRPSPPT